MEKEHKIKVNMKRLQSTLPITPEMMKRKGPEPHCPVPSPIEFAPIIANPVPETTYKPKEVIDNLNRPPPQFTVPQVPKIQIEKSEKYYQKIEEIEMEREAQFQKPKRTNLLVDSKKPEVKVNSTTILRKGARIKKEEENAKKKIEAISSGAYDPGMLERLVEEARAKQLEEEMEAIEMSRLKAQLISEQAAIAKKNTLLANREKMIKYKEEKEEFDRMIEEWREAELIRIHEKVLIANEIKEKAKEAQFQCIANNIKHAREVTEESRILMEEALRQRQEELDRKVALMREIKAMESMKPLRIKEFDPTETSGLGLMSEMSIAELKERLVIVKAEYHDALMNRREAIRIEKERHQNLIEDTQRLIEENKFQSSINTDRSLVMSTARSSVEASPKIQAMRRLLEDRRKHLKNLDKEVKAAGLVVTNSNPTSGSVRIRNNF